MDSTLSESLAHSYFNDETQNCSLHNEAGSSSWHDLMRETWTRAIGQQTDFNLYCFTLVLTETLFIILAFVDLAIAYIPYFQKYKLQKGRYLTRAEVYDIIKMCAMHKVLLLIPATVIFSYWLDVYSPFTLNKDWDSMPPWYEVSFRCILWLLLADAVTYWSHRLAHVPFFYKLYHKEHHAYKMPIGIIVEYTNPIDNLTSGIMSIILGSLMIQNHVLIIWITVTIIQYAGWAIHLGYDIGWMEPMNMIPLYTGTVFHEAHHTKFNGNYGILFRFWDKICGTTFKKPKKTN